MISASAGVASDRSIGIRSMLALRWQYYPIGARTDEGSRSRRHVPSVRIAFTPCRMTGQNLRWGIVMVRFVCLAFSCLTLTPPALNAVPRDSPYEEAIQRALAAVYSGQYDLAEKEFAGMEQLQPGFPAPSVYRELLDSWRAADDPGNPELVSTFQRDSEIAISASRDWIAKHPQEPDGWRYLASAYG